MFCAVINLNINQLPLTWAFPYGMNSTVMYCCNFWKDGINSSVIHDLQYGHKLS